MKKIILLLLVCSCAFNLYAQEITDTTQAGKIKIKTDEEKTKIKDNKAKTKDENGKIKIKDNTDINVDTDSKTKIKDDKVKIKDAEGKVKIKGEGNVNTDNTNSGSMSNNSMSNGTTTTSSTNVNVVTTFEAFPPKPANLPVVGNGVSADVVTILKNKYGATLYDIKQIKSTSGQLIYIIRVMENGGMRSEYVGADGTIVSQ